VTAEQTKNYDQLQFFGDTFHERLRWWRTQVVRVTQVALCETVNAALPESERVAVTTVSNYERSTEPRASFLGALKTSFPQLNVDWLVTGEGRPAVADRGVAAAMERADGQQGALAQLVQMPGMQRFRVVPHPAAYVLLTFLEEVRLTVPEYQGDQSRAWRDFLQRLSHMFFEPFQSPRHFVGREAITDQELTTYTLALVAALRPLVLGLRG
jgi:hypothetical protein